MTTRKAGLDEATLTLDGRGAPPPDLEPTETRSYLLVLEEDSSSIFRLPQTGEVVITTRSGRTLLDSQPVPLVSSLPDSSNTRTHSECPP